VFWSEVTDTQSRFLVDDWSDHSPVVLQDFLGITFPDEAPKSTHSSRNKTISFERIIGGTKGFSG
jgi:hypothetical protein